MPFLLILWCGRPLLTGHPRCGVFLRCCLLSLHTPCGRATKKPRTFAGLQDSRSLPCLRWRGSSLYAESVRQRRRNNNSCRQQNNVNGGCVSGVISSISSHRGEPPFGIERVFRALSRSTVRQHRRGIPRQPSKVHYVDGRGITTSAASAQPVCVPPALQTDTSTPHPAKVPFQQQRMGLIADRMMPQSQTRRNSGQSGRIASASSKS